MTQSYQNLKFKVATVTPVHIHSGSVLFEDRDFYLDGDWIHRIHYLSFLSEVGAEKAESILQQIKNEGLRSLLPKPKKTKKPKVEEDWKQILRAKVGLTVPPPAPEEKKEPVDDTEMKSVLDKAEIYKSSLNFDRRERIGSKIQEIALDNHKFALLPGSTLKGAMRTALYVDTLLKEPERLSRLRFTWTNNPIEADYPLAREMTGMEMGCLGKDILRHLCVGNSNSVSSSHSLGIYQIKVMNIGMESQILWKKGAKKNVETYEEADPLYWEMILPDIPFEFDTTIDFGMKSLIESMKSEKEAAAFSITPESLLHALQSFGKMVAKRELSFAETYKAEFLADFYKDLIQKCEAGEKDGNKAYIPVGSGIPWHGKTIGDLLHHESLDTIRRHFYRYMGKFVHIPSGEAFHGLRLRKAQLQKYGRQIRPDKLSCINPFPKTRHIVFVSGKPSSPPGWICLEMQS